MKSFRVVSESMEHMPHLLLKSRTGGLLQDHEYEPMGYNLESTTFHHKFDPKRHSDEGDQDEQMEYHMHGPEKQGLYDGLVGLGWKRNAQKSVYHETPHGIMLDVTHWEHPNGAGLSKVSIGGGDQPDHSWHYKPPKGEF